MKRQISSVSNPYHPYEWIGKLKAEQVLREAGINARVTIAWCRQNGVSLGGPDGSLTVYRVSLEQYIKRVQHERSENQF